MFLHIKTFDKQISLHSMEAQEAIEGIEEEKDNDDNILTPRREATEAVPADPLSKVIESAMDFWKKKEKDLVVFNSEGKKLDLKKTAAANGLSENDLISVTSQKLLDEEIKKEAELEKERQDAILKASRKGRKNPRKSNK